MAKIFVSGKGSANYTNRDGEVLRTIALPPGVYNTATFQTLCAPGEVVTFDVPVLKRRGNIRTIRHEGHFESAANPHFRMTPAARQARELRAMLARSEALAAFTRKGLKAMARAKKAVPQLENLAAAQVVDGGGEVSAT